MPNLSYDLHIHSCLSPCGDDEMTPANIAGMAKIIGLDVAAVTDHNTCRNCPAFADAAQGYGLIPIFGMELTTMEEVHVLCYFEKLEDALAFDQYVYTQLPDIPNNAAFFGNQLQYDCNDQIIAKEEKLLISATMIPFDQVYDLVTSYHGIMVPAHINKSTTSLLRNLGFIPPDSKFTACELAHFEDWDGLVKEHDYLNNCQLLCSSDAHDLNSLHEPIYSLTVEEANAKEILNVITGGKRECFHYPQITK